MARKKEDFPNLYKRFYQRFRLIAAANGCYPNNLEFEVLQEKGTDIRKISLKEPIFLSRWPVKKALPEKNVDILIYAQFYHRPKCKTLLHNRSSVYVTYLKREKHKKIAIPFENLRFDYHPGSEAEDAVHPLIHAHVFSSKRPEIGLPPPAKFDVKWECISNRLNSLRLPIPNMTLPSVLCCLVACHLGVGEMNALLDKTKKERELFPGLAIDHNQYKLLCSNSFAGSQWFERL